MWLPLSFVGTYVGGSYPSMMGVEAFRDSAVVRQLPSLISDRSPFVNLNRLRGAVWLRPEMVAGVGYQEWLR